jgi:hypothetical protein
MNEGLWTCDTSEDEQNVALDGCRDSLLASCRNGEESLSKKGKKRDPKATAEWHHRSFELPSILHHSPQRLHCPS